MFRTTAQYGFLKTLCLEDLTILKVHNDELSTLILTVLSMQVIKG